MLTTYKNKDKSIQIQKKKLRTETAEKILKNEYDYTLSCNNENTKQEIYGNIRQRQF